MPDLKMPDFNNVAITGNLTRDPELRYLPSGSAVCKLGIASTRRYRTKDGAQNEETLFINVDTWNKSAEWCGENLKKGRPVIVEGRLKSDEWEDRTTGQKRSTISIMATRVQVLTWEGHNKATGSPAGGVDAPIPEDDIPF